VAGGELNISAMAVQSWATAEQKHQIVDMFILGKGMHSWWPMVVPSVIFVLLAWAQYETNKREVRKIKQEMRRIGAEKSALQQEGYERQLRHTRSLEGD
jgi:hypothetical protein